MHTSRVLIFLKNGQVCQVLLLLLGPLPTAPSLPSTPTHPPTHVNRVMHPSSGITKEYSVTLNRKPRPQELEASGGGCCWGGRAGSGDCSDHQAAQPSNVHYHTCPVPLSLPCPHRGLLAAVANSRGPVRPQPARALSPLAARRPLALGARWTACLCSRWRWPGTTQTPESPTACASWWQVGAARGLGGCASTGGQGGVGGQGAAPYWRPVHQCRQQGGARLKLCLA